MRAAELVLHEYYLSTLQPGAPDKLPNWGQYIQKLRQTNGGKDTTVIAILQQIKDSYRNRIMHADVVFSLDDALNLFNLTMGVIAEMAVALPGNVSVNP